MRNIRHIALTLWAVCAALAGYADAGGITNTQEIVVNSAQDGLRLGGGKVTLRDALAFIATNTLPDRSDWRISFNVAGTSRAVIPLASELCVTGSAPVTVDGYNAGRGVTLTTAAGISTRLLHHVTVNALTNSPLTVSNLCFVGGFAQQGGAIFSETRYDASATRFLTNALTVVNCAFLSNEVTSCGAAIAVAPTGTVGSVWTARAHIRNCSFSENDHSAATGDGGVLALGGGEVLHCSFIENISTNGGVSCIVATAASASERLLILNSTFFSNPAADGAIKINAKAAACIVNGVFSQNYLVSETEQNQRDVWNQGAYLALYGCLTSAKDTTVFGTSANVSVDDVYDISVDTFFLGYENVAYYAVNGATHRVLRPRYSKTMVEKCYRIDHSADGSSVKLTGTAGATTGSVVLRGDGSAATCRVTEDLIGVTIDYPGHGAVQCVYSEQIALDPNGGALDATNRTVNAFCGQPLPALPTPRFNGYDFLGWRDAASNIWEKGAYTKMPFTNGVALVAAWQPTDALLKVTASDDGQNLESGLITLRDAAYALGAYPAYFTGGAKNVITFDSEITKITLTNAITFAATAVSATLRGPATGAGVVLDGDGKGGILSSAAPSLAVENLTLQNAAGSGNGGAIFATGGLTVSNCLIASCSAANGGGLAFVPAAGQTALVAECTFLENTSRTAGSGAAYVQYGAASARQTLTFRNCSFVANGKTTDKAVALSGACAANSAVTFRNCSFLETGTYSASGTVASHVQNLATLTNTTYCVPGATAGSYRFTATAGTVTHTFPYALADASVIGDAAAGTSPATDLLGRAQKAGGQGAVRSTYAIKVTFDPQGGGTIVDEDKVGYDRCLEANTEDAPLPTAVGSYVFKGWYAQKEKKGTQYYDAQAHPVGECAFPLQGAITLYAGWSANMAAFTVTTELDIVSDYRSNIVSLRDAVRAMLENPHADDRTISFKIAGNAVTLTNAIVIPAAMRPFAIDGYNGGLGVTISPAAGWTGPLFRPQGEGLTLKNLTLAYGQGGGDATSALAAGVVVAEGPFAAENCLFYHNYGYHAGAVTAKANVLCRFDGCTFQDNTAAGPGAGAVYMPCGTLALANSTFHGNVATGSFASEMASAVRIAAGAKGAVTYSTFVENALAPCALRFEGAGGVVGCVFADNRSDAAQTRGDDVAAGSGVTLVRNVLRPATLGTDNVERDRTELFSDGSVNDNGTYLGGKATTGTRDTVAHVWYEPLIQQEYLDKPVYVWCDTSGSNVAYATSSGGAKTALFGTAAAAGTEVVQDQLGTVAAFTGRGAIRSRAWTRLVFDTVGGEVLPDAVRRCGSTAETVPVTSRTNWIFGGWRMADGTRAFDADGKPVGTFTVPYAATVPLTAIWTPTKEALRVTSSSDAEHLGYDVVTLRDALRILHEFPSMTDRTVTFASGITKISLASPLILTNGTQTITIDGAPVDGETGVTLDGGGAARLLLARGNCTLQNLTLQNGYHAGEGGAVLVTNGCTRFRATNCRFSGNRAATRGGAVSAPVGGNLFFASCTFDANDVTAAGGRGGAFYGGATVATFVYSTFLDNGTTLADLYGGALAFGGKDDFVVAACTFVGNGASATRDGTTLHAANLVRQSTVFGCALQGADTKYALWQDGASQPLAVARTSATCTKLASASAAAGCSLDGSSCVTGAAATSLFTGGTTVRTHVEDGVSQLTYTPNENEVATTKMNAGAFLWYDDDAAHLAWSATSDRVDLTALRGNTSSAATLRTTDQLGARLSTPYRGAAVPESGSLVVTTLEDVADEGDGDTSLREAIDAANRRVVQPNDGKSFKITFSSALFATPTSTVTCALNGATALACKVPIVITGASDYRRVKLAVSNCGAASDGATVEVGYAGSLTLRNLAVDLNVPSASTFNNTLDVAAGETCPKTGIFIQAKGRVTFEHCAFTGSGAENGFILSSYDRSGAAAGTMHVIEGCSFTGAKCGTLFLSGVRPVRVLNDTFSGVRAETTTYPGVLALGGTDFKMVVNTTIAECCAPYGPLYVENDDTGGRVAIVNCIILGNESSGKGACDAGWTDLCAEGYNAHFVRTFWGRRTQIGHSFWTNCTQLVAKDQTFDGGLRWEALDGVDIAYRKLKAAGDADRQGAFIYHDAGWTNLATTVSLKVPKKELVLGTSITLANIYLNEDCVGRPVWGGIYLPTDRNNKQNLPASPGAYAALTDAEANERGTLTVTTFTDDGKTGTRTVPYEHDSYDGALSLREAVDFAQCHPAWRDAAGCCTVTFDRNLWSDVDQAEVKWIARQIEVTGFTNGTLVIRGPTEAGKGMTFNGNGKYRLFHVAAGNDVVFENVTITNGYATTSGLKCQGKYQGGAIYNQGRIVISNAAIRACTSYGSSYDGGAIYNAANATATVVRCTFAGCTAANGGAFLNASGALATFVDTTFSGNRATASSGSQGGGAVCSENGAFRTSFVNCTLVGNASARNGGAICAAGRSGTYDLYLLNTVAVGNTATLAGGDAYESVKAKVRTSWLGDCNDVANDDRWDIDGSVSKTGALPAEALTGCLQDGTPVPLEAAVGGVMQTYYALNPTATKIGSYVKRFNRSSAGDWEYVWYGTVPATSSAQALWGTPGTARFNYARRWTTDLLGTDTTLAPHVGSAAVYTAPVPEEPTPAVDPLRVTTGTFAAFQSALDYARQQRAEAVSGQPLTITFDAGLTIPISDETVIDVATNGVPLRLLGPVTLKLQDGARGRFFHVKPDNTLILENVSLQNGYHPAYGGAVLVESGELWASNCTFLACTAGNWSDDGETFTDDGQGGGQGGAVALFEAAEGGVTPLATFVSCTFTGCTAVSGAYAGEGNDVYQEDAASGAFYGCTFDGAAAPAANAIVLKPGARTEKSDGTRNYFGTLEEALGDAVRGDTLVRMNENASTATADGFAVPDGVTFVDETSVTLSLAAAAAPKTASLKRTVRLLTASTGPLERKGELSAGMTISDGIYDAVKLGAATKSVSLAGSSNPGITVSGTAAICVPEGVTLNVTGANASGQSRGYAGIRVPTGSTLIIFGGGTVNAQGGAAAGGSSGGSAGSSYVHWACSGDNDWGWFGAGGTGGNGGGGGGAGIGGNGGYGGNGGAGGAGGESTKKKSAPYSNRSSFHYDGNGGGDGQHGNGSGNSTALENNIGAIYILGPTTVKATPGGLWEGKNILGVTCWNALGGSSGNTDSSWVFPGGWNGYYRAGASAGGGGGGGGWPAPYGFGGGGGGGSGGGGGGTGALSWWSEPNYGNGSGGTGGKGYYNGSSGSGTYQAVKHNGNTDVFPGKGGGSANQDFKQGSKATVRRSARAALSGDHTAETAETFDRLQFQFKLLKNDGSLERWSDGVEYGGYPNDTVTVPEIQNQIFLGYFDKGNGEGTQWYNSDGTPIKTTQFFYIQNTSLWPYFVNERDFVRTGVTINGRDAAYRTGSGWRWDKDTKILTLQGVTADATSYVLAGTNLTGEVWIRTEGKVLLDMQNLCLREAASGNVKKQEALLVVAEGSAAALMLTGTNTIERTDGPAIRVAGTFALTNDYGAVQSETLVVRGAGTGTGAAGLVLASAGSAYVSTGTLFAYGGSKAPGIGYETSGSAFGKLRVLDGVVSATGGAGGTYDIGPVSGTTLSKAVVLSGGSLRCNGKANAACVYDEKGNALRCLTAAVPDFPTDREYVSVTNLSTFVTNVYGTAHIHALDGFVHVWTRNGFTTLYVNGFRGWSQSDTGWSDVLFGTTGLRVDGRNACTALGTGWRWQLATSNLEFTVAGGTYTLDGTDTNGVVHPVTDLDTTLVLDGAHLRGYGARHGVLEARTGTLTLKPTGASNTILPLDHFRGSGVAVHTAATAVFAGTGTLVASGGVWGAGIGIPFENYGERPSITFSSGTTKAYGGFEGAGVGGASGVCGARVTVASGANVTAQGGYGAAGVGAGAWSAEAGTLQQGGTLTATGGYRAENTGRGNVDSGWTRAAGETATGTGLTVTRATDAAGSGTSLREAIANCAAAGGGIVSFDAALRGQTILLAKRIVVDAGEGRVILNGADLGITLKPAAGYADAATGGGALLHQGSGTLEVRGLSFADFTTAGCGGAIRAEGTLTLTNCTFTGCASGEYGGAVYAETNAPVSCTVCRFSENASACASGGAVFARDRFTVTRSSFDGNVAPFGGGAVATARSATRAVAEHVSFLGNAAGERGGGLDAQFGSAVLAACTFTKNTGGAFCGATELYAASTLSVGNTAPCAAFPPDGEAGLNATTICFHTCTVGSVAPGVWLNLYVGQTADAVFKAATNDVRQVAQTRQIYRPLGPSNKAIVQGCPVWHSENWGALGISETTYGTVTTLYGTVAPSVMADTDQLGEPVTDTKKLVGAVLDSAEAESLVVTTAEDVVNPEDNRTSLREAIQYACSSDMKARRDGYREITFAPGLFDAATKTLTVTAALGAWTLTDGRFVAINGGTDGNAVFLKAGAGTASRGWLFELASGTGLALENLTILPGGYSEHVAHVDHATFIARNVRFDGGGTQRQAIQAKNGALVWYERCTFTDLCATDGDDAAILWQESGTAHALDCMFYGNRCTGGRSLIELQPAGRFDMVDCTAVSNTFASATADTAPAVLSTAATNGVLILNSVFTGNTDGKGTSCDFSCGTTVGGVIAAATTWCRSVGSGISAAYGSGCTNDVKLTADVLFAGGVRTTAHYGVNHLFFRPKGTGPICGTGVFAFHDVEWLHLGYGTYASGQNKSTLRGNASRATTCVNYDLVERTVVEGHIARGCYATCTDPEYFDDGVMCVNTPVDFLTATTEHDYDGLLTLREAVTFAQENPAFRDGNGDCRILFTNGFFTAGKSGTVKMTHEQMIVATNFTTGTLRIIGSDDRAVHVSGEGRYRIFRNKNGNRLEIRNVAFTNGLATASDNAPLAGGAIYNGGTLTLSNCVFRGCIAGGSTNLAALAGHACGGAVYTAAGCDTVALGCTFAGCAGAYGGAVFTADGASTTAASCTFDGNRAVRGILITQPIGGALASDGPGAATVLVNCTLTGNSSEGEGGGVAAVSTDASNYSLYMLSSIAVGNVSAYGGADLACAGRARVAYSAFGLRSAALDGTWDFTSVLSGITTNDAFKGTAAVETSAGAMKHRIFPAADALYGTSLKPVYARYTERWRHIAACPTAGSGGTSFRGTLRLARRGTLWRTDQTGRAMSEPVPGATGIRTLAVTLVKANGQRLAFTSVAAAGAAAEAGDALVLLTEDVSAADGAAVPGGVTVSSAAGTGGGVSAFLQAAAASAQAFTAANPWYTATVTAGGVVTELNEQATPALDGEAETDLTGDETAVTIRPANVKPLLWYGLGHADTPAGPYAVEADGWVQADAEGNLPASLTAPKEGSCGFYRVIVQPARP